MSVDILHMICEAPSKPLHSEIERMTSPQSTPQRCKGRRVSKAKHRTVDHGDCTHQV